MVLCRPDVPLYDCRFRGYGMVRPPFPCQVTRVSQALLLQLACQDPQHLCRVLSSDGALLCCQNKVSYTRMVRHLNFR